MLVPALQKRRAFFIYMPITILDVEYANFTNTPIFYHKDNSEAIEVIKQNVQSLINAYKEMDFDISYNFCLDTNTVNSIKKSFEEKKCQYCKSELIYRKSYDFWGCSNYKAEGKHTSITGKNPTFYPSYYRVPVNWLTDIIIKCGLKGKVNAKSLLSFYLENGFEDLRLKYGKTCTGKRINGLVDAKERSLEQEKQALDYLSLIGKVAYQQCITYKLKDGKEKFCIPDFILGTGEYVKVVDAKLDMADDDKMDLYITLVQFILMKINDKRTVTGAHLFFKDFESEWIRRSKHEIIEIDDINGIR